MSLLLAVAPPLASPWPEAPLLPLLPLLVASQRQEVVAPPLAKASLRAEDKGATRGGGKGCESCFILAYARIKPASAYFYYLDYCVIQIINQPRPQGAEGNTLGKQREAASRLPLA